MSLANPGADSFVIRVFAPLIVVLANADRTGAPLGREAWIHAFQSFAIHHFYPAAVAVVFIVAFVAVLMNFLLYRESGDEPDDEPDRYEDGLTVQTVPLPHTLDIIKLSGHENGHFVSIALDRSIAISVFDKFQQTRHTISIPPEILATAAWPIHNAVVDDNADWMACHSANGHVLIYNCVARAFVQTLQFPDDHPAVMFQFTRLPNGERSQSYFVVLTSGGRLTMICVETGQTINLCLSQVPLLGATIIEASTQSRRLIFATEDSRVVTFNWMENTWMENNAEALPIQPLHGRMTGVVRLDLNSDLGSDILVVITSTAVAFMDSQTLATIGSFDLESHGDPHGSLLIDHITDCPSCGSVAFRYLALTNDPAEARECNLVTLSLGEDDKDPICLRKTQPSCQSFSDAQRTNHKVSAKGGWHPVKSQGVLGLRRRKLPTADDNAARLKDSTSAQVRLRRRTRLSAQSTAGHEQWEAYKLSLGGELETVPVSATSEVLGPGHETALYVNSAGPTVSLDVQSIAVAFGDGVKIIRTARRGAMVHRDDGPVLSRQSSTNRKRLNFRKGQ